MRVLITTTGSDGHFGPLIPFAEAIRAGGDSVIVATRESTADRVRAAGYEVWPFADAPAGERAAIFAALRDLPTEDANLRVGVEVFAGLDTRAALRGVLDVCAAWRPHVVLAEVSEFAGLLAGAHLGIPVVTAAITLGSTEHRFMDAVLRELDDVREERGLDVGAPPAAHFTLAPPLLEHPDAPGPEHVRRFRERNGLAPAPPPDRWDGADDPLVYVTFGSVAPQRDYFPRLYRAAIDALAPLPLRVLVTVGRDRDPDELGALPPNVHVEHWIPQADVLPHAAAMLCHGGFGTVRGALAAGVPLVVLPLFADQPYNAQRVAEIGAGIALAQGAEGVSGAADAVRAVLAEPSYAERAAAVAADTRALPTADSAVAILHDLAGQRV
jgi:UDP:flavonoid glycosyltransferase YjiC (YdhE family)